METHLGDSPFSLDFHPSNQLVATALITGDLHLYAYSADTVPQRLFSIPAHTKSCRAVRFINGGRAIVTGSSDCSILATDSETGSPIARLEDSHGYGIYSLINLTESIFASGDDKGYIKMVWDTRQRTLCNSFDAHTTFVSDMTFASDAMKLLGTRQRTLCNSFDAHTTFVSDMTFASDAMKLLGTSGDGTLSVCNLRRNRVQVQSEFSEEDLTSIVMMKDGRKVVCGSLSGTLLLYSWGYFKGCSDRFTALAPNSVDVLLKLDEDRLITGSENGLISLVRILPNKVIQPIAEHSEFPIEGLAFSYDRKFLGSISHDSMLKLWDLDDLLPSTGNTSRQPAAVDSDTVDMDVDNKGTESKSVSEGNVGSSSNSFFCRFVGGMVATFVSVDFLTRPRGMIFYPLS